MPKVPLDYQGFLKQITARDNPQSVPVQDDNFEHGVDAAMAELRIPVDPNLLHWHGQHYADSIENAGTKDEPDFPTQQQAITVDGKPTLTYEQALCAYERYEDDEFENHSESNSFERLIDDVARAQIALKNAYWPDPHQRAADIEPLHYRWKQSDVTAAIKELAKALYDEAYQLNICPDKITALKTAKIMAGIVRETREKVLGEKPQTGRTER
jgi:hypothetical protein